MVLFSCFLYFLSAMAIEGRHCAFAWFVHSSYLLIDPEFISVNYSHPIAAEVLIVFLRTVNSIVKTILQKIVWFLHLLSRVLNFNFNLVYSFLLTVLYRKNCNKSFAQITEESITPKYFEREKKVFSLDYHIQIHIYIYI